MFKFEIQVFIVKLSVIFVFSVVGCGAGSGQAAQDHARPLPGLHTLPTQVRKMRDLSVIPVVSLER